MVATMQAAADRMGCTANGSQRLYTGEGLNNIETIADTADEVISNMCKILRRDGNVLVLAMAENNVKLGCFVARHYRRISRNLKSAGLTKKLINNYKDLKAEEDAHETTPDNKVEINNEDWAKTVDSMKDYLSSPHLLTYATCLVGGTCTLSSRLKKGDSTLVHVGTCNHSKVTLSVRLRRSKIPLVHIIRNNVDVPAEAGDPQNNCDVHQDEMIARAPHQDAVGDPLDVYTYDNRQVWDLISGWTLDMECWVHIKPFQRRRNGRDAYYALYNHCLGVNTINNQARTQQDGMQG